MRFKLSLSVNTEAYGNILPISYQYELSAAIRRLLTAEPEVYNLWLKANSLDSTGPVATGFYAVSNLYIPRILVNGDRLTIKAPRVQCWLSFMPSVETEAFVHHSLEGKKLLLGDRVSKVLLTIDTISLVSPVEYTGTMEYTSLAPVVVMGVRPGRAVEFLSPENPYFAQFLVEGLVERYERLMGVPYQGPVDYAFELLFPAKRKGVNIERFTSRERRVVGYMVKFRLTLSPELQRLGYETGFGDEVDSGFGYVELLNKKAD